MNINWFPGHMAKAIKEINEKINLVDMVIEVCDARAINASCNPLIKELVKNKFYLKVASKADLADENVSNMLKKKFEQENIAAIFADLGDKSIYKLICNKILDVSKPLALKDIKRGLKPRNVRVMVVGIPNVGKSTLINLLAKRKSAPVGNTPGFTRAQKWVKCAGFDLLDTPGILWPNLKENEAGIKLALIGCIKDTILPSLELSKVAIEYLGNNYQDVLEAKYGVKYSDAENYLHDFALSKGHLLKDGELDIDRSAIFILNELKNGRIGKISLEGKENNNG